MYCSHILLNYIINLQSNWNSLREWIKDNRDFENIETIERDIFDIILDKMNELEGKNK